MNEQSTIQYPAVPLTNVFLRSGYELAEGSVGTTIRYVDLPGLSAAILYAVITKPGRLSNTELVYLRRKLDFSQAECAELLGIKEQTLSLWERNQYSLPVATDALLRRICIEDLSRFVPKKSRFPSTASLIRLASSVFNGMYECRFDQDSWKVNFLSEGRSSQADPVAVVADKVFIFATPGKFRLEEARATFGVISRIYESEVRSKIGNLEILGASQTRVSGATYETNPATGALFLVPSYAASTEGNVT